MMGLSDFADSPSRSFSEARPKSR